MISHAMLHCTTHLLCIICAQMMALYASTTRCCVRCRRCWLLGRRDCLSFIHQRNHQQFCHRRNVAIQILVYRGFEHATQPMSGQNICHVIQQLFDYRGSVYIPHLIQLRSRTDRYSCNHWAKPNNNSAHVVHISPI